MFTIRQFARGEVIFRESEVGETAYIIDRGRVEVLRNLDGTAVHLAYIEAGEPFGEMSIIDEKPRSATVVAVEPTTVRELHRDDFLKNLSSHPEVTISLLKVIFERLRETNATVLQLYKSHPELLPHNASRPVRQLTGGTAVFLEGLTPEAAAALPEVRFRIPKFPFRIGRLSNDALAHNDLSIPDQEPLQISRHHLSFVQSGDRIAVSDRGSRMGSLVDGMAIGAHSTATTCFLSGHESTLILGNHSSPFRFRIVLNQAQAASS